MRFIKYLTLLSIFTSCSATTQYEKIDNIVYSANSKILTKFQYCPFGTGRVGPGEAKGYTFSAESYQSPTIEKARKLILQYTHELVDLVNTKFMESGIHDPVDQSFFSNAILFIDSHGDFIEEEGKVSRVSLTNNLIKYRAWDSTHNTFKVVFEESYEEAMLKVAVTNSDLQ